MRTLVSGEKFTGRTGCSGLLGGRCLGCHATIPFGGALRDVPKNGCEGDQVTAGSTLEFFLKPTRAYKGGFNKYEKHIIGSKTQGFLYRDSLVTKI